MRGQDLSRHCVAIHFCSISAFSKLWSQSLSYPPLNLQTMSSLIILRTIFPLYILFTMVPSSSRSKFSKHLCLRLLILSRGAVLTVCSHIFTLFWLRKTSVIVEILQLFFRMFVYAFHPDISSFFFCNRFLIFPIFVLIVFIMYVNINPALHRINAHNFFRIRSA